jgi:fumarate reductase subunit D
MATLVTQFLLYFLSGVKKYSHLSLGITLPFQWQNHKDVAENINHLRKNQIFCNRKKSSQLLFCLVFGSVPGLTAGIAPIVSFSCALVMAPCGLVKNRKSLK